MTLRDDVSQAVKAATLARDKERLGTLRLISSRIKDLDIEARGKSKGPVADDEILAGLAKMIKQREESAGLYEKGGRPELAAQERAEIEIVRAFMPKQMGEDEVRAAAQAAIAETGAASPKDMGKVMAILKERHAGSMDFGKASGVVKGLLG
jgi:uncharacterized protein YqeY